MYCRNEFTDHGMGGQVIWLLKLVLYKSQEWQIFFSKYHRLISSYNNILLHFHPWDIPGLIHWMKMVFSPAIIFTVWKYLKKNFKKRRKSNIQKNQCFPHWIWSRFHSQDMVFLIYFHSWKYWKSSFTRKIKTILNVKSLNTFYMVSHLYELFSLSVNFFIYWLYWHTSLISRFWLNICWTVILLLRRLSTCIIIFFPHTLHPLPPFIGKEGHAQFQFSITPHTVFMYMIQYSFTRRSDLDHVVSCPIRTYFF